MFYIMTHLRNRNEERKKGVITEKRCGQIKHGCNFFRLKICMKKREVIA